MEGFWGGGGRWRVTEHKRCVLIVYIIMSKTFLILNGKEGDMIINVYLYSFKLQVILFGVLCSLDFLDILSKNTKIWKFIKIRPVGAEIFHENGRKDGLTYVHDEANSRFS